MDLRDFDFGQKIPLEQVVAVVAMVAMWSIDDGGGRGGVSSPAVPSDSPRVPAVPSTPWLHPVSAVHVLRRRCSWEAVMP